MSERVLIIDDNANFRASLIRLLNRDCPDLVIYEYDPIEKGKPTASFNWLTYDLVLLDDNIADQDGFEWLVEFREHPNFPTVVMMLSGGEELQAKAINLGADDFLSKANLTRSILKSTIHHALKFTAAKHKSHEMAVRDAVGPDIEGFRMLRKIGQGGMSSIYLAERESDKQTVVAKILYSESIDDETFVDRFLQEYELICKLDNQNIVKIYEQSYTEEYMYMIMEYFPNGDLHQRIVQSTLYSDQAVDFLVKIASGLSAIHSCGVIHRDLKPANIMFRENYSPAIIDFGISKEVSYIEESTNDNVVMGTLSYMSPECGQGKIVDARSDIYSLGIMFYEMLTGDKPYKGNGAADVVLRHVRDPIPKLPEDHKRLQALFEIMVAKDPDNRFQSADLLIEFVNRHYSDLLPPPN